LRKIPVERRNISQAEWGVKFRVEYDLLGKKSFDENDAKNFFSRVLGL
jgi:hypothetical protein